MSGRWRWGGRLEAEFWGRIGVVARGTFGAAGNNSPECYRRPGVPGEQENLPHLWSLQLFSFGSQRLPFGFAQGGRAGLTSFAPLALIRCGGRSA